MGRNQCQNVLFEEDGLLEPKSGLLSWCSLSLRPPLRHPADMHQRSGQRTIEFTRKLMCLAHGQPRLAPNKNLLKITGWKNGNLRKNGWEKWASEEKWLEKMDV